VNGMMIKKKMNIRRKKIGGTEVVRERKCYKLWRKGKRSKDRYLKERKKLRGYPEERQREKERKKE